MVAMPPIWWARWDKRGSDKDDWLFDTVKSEGSDFWIGVKSRQHSRAGKVGPPPHPSHLL